MSKGQPYFQPAAAMDDRVTLDGTDVIASWRPAPFQPAPDVVRQVSGVCFAGRTVLLVKMQGNQLALPGGKPEPG
jgi:hypothetical protein